ncbi:MAG: hypothetical protein FJ291_31420 [Planctomycetes bacterium]|nr:hypothetical protein [Planctomycetota bacterium]
MKSHLFVFVAVVLAGCLPSGAARKPTGPPPLPVLGPMALMGDPGDGKAFLRWNPQIEDRRVVGWRVRRAEGEGALLTEPACTVSGLANGQSYRFAVVGVLADGRVTPPSNSVTVTPRAVAAAKLSDLRAWAWDARTGKLAKAERSDSLSFGEFKDVPLVAHPVRVTFPDGQELVYDRFRPVDWKTRDGAHLLYPRHFGNGLDIGKFDNRGLAVIVPPHPPSEVEDAQRGSPHPHLTDPMTLALDRAHHDAQPRWFPPQVEGDRVTFHYWQPMAMMGYRAWIFVRVWETWWPIERDRQGCKYHGLARLVEVEVPSVWKHGYQVMLNNGFGPGGSRKGVVSYNTGFREPGREIVDFSGDRNRQVYFQGPKPPRRAGGYHPSQDCLQAQPLIFYDWPTGSLTITARSLYYHAANNSASYPEQGADGVWPSLAWDLGQAGKRVAVDTIEYLYTADKSQPLPQRYLNARAETLAAVSERMGVQDTLAATNVTGTHWGAKGDGGPAPHAEKWVKALHGSPCDGFFNYHEFWHAVPITVDDAYRLDATHDCNPQMKAMCDRLQAAGLNPGFWFRPEFVKTALPTALSDRIPTARAYYGYDGCHYPDVPALLAERGIPLFRENTQWVRRQRDGAWPVNTPYQWVPMSLATGWWDRIMWPTLAMSRKLGFGWLLMDGGFGGLSGVDYAPMLNGETDSAVPCQPFWWRMFRSMHHIGMKNYGECTVGWKAGFTNLVGEGDEHFLWMFSFSSIWGRAPKTAEQVHKVYQLYNGLPMPNPWEKEAADIAPVRRFACDFYRRHRPPDWIELRDLRQGEPVTLRAKPKDSPAAGIPTRIDDKDSPAETVRPWTWTDAIWHYADGTSVAYPALDKLPSR